VVKFLFDRGFQNIYGIVGYLNNAFPELQVIQGDILQLPYEKNFFDVVLSYGVIEHFPDGPDAPLKAMYDVLKPGGVGVITVPSFNYFRKIQYFFDTYFFNIFNIKKNNLLRRILGKKQIQRNGKKDGYFIHPQVGNFFEYRFTLKQFKDICQKAGFSIIEDAPIDYIDGFYQSFGPHTIFKKLSLIKVVNGAFKVNFLGSCLNGILKSFPSFNNHMHVCIVKKPYNSL